MVVSLAALVARFGGELVGDGAQEVSQVAPLDRATPDEIGFVSQSKYLSQLAGTRAGAVILPADARDATELPRILTPNPYLYFARVSALLNPPPRPPAGIHAAASVAPDAEIAADASIAAGAVIGSGALAGALAQVAPGVWEVSGAPGARSPVRACFASLDQLEQFEHRGRTCAHKVLSDAGTSLIVQYSCSGSDFGRSQVTALTPRSLRIETQGISDGLPFYYVLQARRVADCPGKNVSMSGH